MNSNRPWTHKRRLAAVTLALATATAALAGTSVGGRAASGCPQPSLSPSTFEIDGNLTFDCAAGTDWNTPALHVSPGVDLPSGSGDNAFGQGTHENDSAASVVLGSIPPNKNDLTRFYLADEFVNNAPFLYLAWERAVNIGSADMDFEINQLPQPPFSVGKVTLNRMVGDLLVLFEFSGSGAPMIQVATWQGSAWGTPMTLNSGSALAMVNSGTVTDPLNGNAPLTTGLFGEAAINLQAAGIFNPALCENFSSAYVKARSSGSSFNAELKDFIAPIHVSLSSCVTPGVSTQVTPSSGTGTVGSTSFADSATISGVSGNVAGETVNFSLFGPNPIATGSSTFDCSPGTSLTPVYTATAKLGQSGTTATTPSTAGTVLSATGTYYWVAYYPGDRATGGQNLAAQSGCTDEPITVTKAAPSMSTTASTPQGGITVGSTVTIGDTATLSSAFQPSGTVSFSLYGPFTGGGTPTCTATSLVASSVASPNPATGGLSGVTASTGAVTFSPTAVGTYYWVATYGGDPNNQGAGPSGCGDTNEAVVVSPATPTLSTTILLGDSVKVSTAVSGVGSPTGTVTFALFGPFADTGSVSCTGTPIATQTASLAADGTAATTSSVPVAPGFYAWQASYSPTNGNFSGTTTTCTAEQASISYQAPSPIP